MQNVTFVALLLADYDVNCNDDCCTNFKNMLFKMISWANNIICKIIIR